MLTGSSMNRGRRGGSSLERALGRALARDKQEPAWQLGPALVVLMVGWIAMVWPWLSGRVTIPWDAKAHFQPQIQFLAQSIARGEWPTWAPFVFSGHPQIADPQSMLFSPPFLLLALIDGNPGLWAVDMTVLLMQLAGAAALVVWFRDQDWHWAGAIIAGLVFAFGASMAWRLQHTGQVLSLAYWPMAMVAIDRAFALKSFRWSAVAGIVGAFILLGRDQVALLVIYLLAAQVTWRWLSSDRPSEMLRDMAGPLTTGGLIAIAIVSIPIMLTTLLTADSNRPAIDAVGAGRGSFHPALFLTFVAPQVFGAAYRMEDYWGPPSFAWSDSGLFIAQNMGQVYLGALPVLLLLLAAWQGQFLAREIRFFSVAFVIVILYALGWYTPVFRVLYELVPGVKFYRRPADATFLIGGLGAVLTGYAVHRLFTQPWDKWSEHAIALTCGVVVLAFVIAFGCGMWLDRLHLLVVPLGIAGVCVAGAAIALGFAKSRIALEPWPMALLLVTFTAADLAYNNGPSTSSAWRPGAYDVFEPNAANATVKFLDTKLAEARVADTTGARRDRIELLGVGFHWPNASLTHGWENTLGYNPLRLQLYSKATGAEDHVGMVSQRKFSALLPSYNSMLVDMLGLRFIVSGEPIEPHDKGLKPGDLTLLGKTQHAGLDAGKMETAYVYENPRALPRVIMATRSEGANFADLLTTGQWPAFDPRSTVLLDGASKVVYASFGALPPSPPKARILSYRNAEVVVEADSSRGGWLVLNDPWHPWWFAEVDGKPAPLLRANVLFRAVELPAGRHEVRFRFQPLKGAWRQLWGSAVAR